MRALGVRMLTVFTLGLVGAVAEKAGLASVAIVNTAAVLICIGVSIRFVLRLRPEKASQIVPIPKSRSTAAGL